MKRIAALLFVLSSVCFSAADTLTLDSGVGQMSGFATFPSYQFGFGGPRASIFVQTGPPLFGDWPDAPGLQNCLSCDPRGSLIILEDSGNSFSMEFDAVSFVSSLAPNRDLTVIYTATARMFFETDLQGSVCNADPCLGPNLVWNRNIHWLVTAQYAPDSSNPGKWSFVDATFTPAVAPEPSTMLLMGSGMVILIRKFRRKQRNS
jgi:hypothetical protein